MPQLLKIKYEMHFQSQKHKNYHKLKLNRRT